MAESAELQCEPCLHENITKFASRWCTDCEESLCDDCCRRHKAYKMSKNNYIITSGDYQKTKKLNVNLECSNHREQLYFYCPTHDSVLCVVCIQLKHSSCMDLKPLDKAAKGVTISTALTDVEQAIDGLLENIERGVQHLQQNKTNLEEQEDVTKKSIATKREEIHKHLDLLEEKLLKELKYKSEKAVKEISLVTSKLETKRKNILDIKDTAEIIKRFSSNLHMFVGIRIILKNVVTEVNGIKLLVNSVPQLSIAVQFNPKLDTLTKVFDSLGEIQVTSKEAVVPYAERRLIQAQFQRPAEQPVHKLDNLQLKLRTKIEIGEQNYGATGCLILPNNGIMITSNNKPSLTILKEDGSHARDISVPYDPYDVTIIDDQRVAVSYGSLETGITCITCITIVNITNQRPNQTLENLCLQRIYGIAYNDGKLYAVAEGEGIKVIDLDGNIIKTIRIYNSARNTQKVTAQKEKIYFSVRHGLSVHVHCIDMEGTEIWTCRDDRLRTFSYSPAIAIDNYGITFAAGFNNNLLLAISPDGKQKKVLLTNSDGLQLPNAVYYDKDSQRLLVCNYASILAALYDVIY